VEQRQLLIDAPTSQINYANLRIATLEDLPENGTTLIAKRVEIAMKQRQGKELKKKNVLVEMLKEFDSWTTISDLPTGTADNAERLFKNINAAFGVES
ncbi:hypothetical protein, partial [Halomonas alimentaria]